MQAISVIQDISPIRQQRHFFRIIKPFYYFSQMPGQHLAGIHSSRKWPSLEYTIN